MKKNSSQLSVLTFNAWGLKVGAISIARSVSERITRIAHAINDLKPDVVGFQEIWTEESAHELMRRLQYPYFSYHPGRRRVKGRLGNGLLFFSRYPIVEEHQITYTRYTQWFEFFSNKGALMIKIDTPAGYIQLFNTHLGAGKRPVHTAQRMAQLKELQTYLTHFSRRYPSILLGDMNFNPNMSEYGIMRQWMDDCFNDLCIDTYSSLNPNKDGYTFYKDRSFTHIKDKHDIDERIDYIFVLRSKENRTWIDPLQSTVALDDRHDPLSDHCAVYTTFEITRKKTLADILPAMHTENEKIYLFGS